MFHLALKQELLSESVVHAALVASIEAAGCTMEEATILAEDGRNQHAMRAALDAAVSAAAFVSLDTLSVQYPAGMQVLYRVQNNNPGPGNHGTILGVSLSAGKPVVIIRNAYLSNIDYVDPSEIGAT